MWCCSHHFHFFPLIFPILFCVFARLLHVSTHSFVLPPISSIPYFQIPLQEHIVCVCLCVSVHVRTLKLSRWWPYSFFPRLTLTIHYRQQTKPIPHPPPCNTYTHTRTKCPVNLPLGQQRSQNFAWPSVSVDTLSFQTVPALLWLNLLTFLIPSPWLKFLLLHFFNPQQEWRASDDSLSIQFCMFFWGFFLILSTSLSGFFWQLPHKKHNQSFSFVSFSFNVSFASSLYFYGSVIK